MLKFTKIIFLGSGKYSLQEVQKLKDRLDEAIIILGGLQQPGHPESAKEARLEEEWYNNEKSELKDAVIDIVTAFGVTPKELQDHLDLHHKK
jgi:hypothetical protein